MEHRPSVVSKFSTKTGIVSIIVSLLLIALFARLGLWQLDRADEKKAMLAAKDIASNNGPLLTLEREMSMEDVEYRNVKLSGKYDYTRQFLLDNRIYHKQAGYEVITPFYVAMSDDFILVNRGWVGHNGKRDIKPEIPHATGAVIGENPDTVALSGILTNPSKGFSIGPALVETEPASSVDSGRNWPLVLQYIDYATIADKVDKIPVVNGVVVADQGQNGDLIYNWQPVANGPMKHYGYAFQWFAMLVAVVVLFIYLNFFKRINE